MPPHWPGCTSNPLSIAFQCFLWLMLTGCRQLLQEGLQVWLSYGESAQFPEASMRAPLPWHEKTNTLPHPLPWQQWNIQWSLGAGLSSPRSRASWVDEQRDSSPDQLPSVVSMWPTLNYGSFSPALFSNLTQAQEHVSKSAAHAVMPPGNTTLVFLLLQTCPMFMRDFLGKILSFRKKSSCFLWGPLPFPTSPTSPEIRHLFLPTSIFLLGRAVAGKRGGLSWWLLVWFCHLLINAKKCTDSSVGSSDTLFRMPGPHSPPLWVLVANWRITGKDPTQILCSGTTKKKRNSKRREANRWKVV